MPGGQFPGTGRRYLEPQAWRPVLWQTAAVRAEGNKLAMRRPGDEGWYVQSGVWVNGQVNVIFNAAGTGANNLVLLLPILPQIPPGVSSGTNDLVVGTFFIRRSATWNYTGTLTCSDAVGGLTAFRTTLTAADTAWGINPNIAIAAADELCINLSYLGV